MNQKVRHCPTCEGEIIGRTDKRFCSDQCRFLFNNAKKREDKSELLIQRVNATLRKNRTLLKQASPEGKTTLRREVLQLAGFDFRHFTHLYRTKSGNTYHFCYDYGYLLLEDEKVLIVNWQPYMDK
ncbi:DUF2116 family Zn-ribbon domain-containing protein [Pontibacter anaerobius]|uniref:DUF2116 family Zn-ribbon domain-containing protein n=1 Tax=Pontibacter anaerobius TaxID=2993940 RepID=A0ABT3RDT0_9BACT|nr:DUF2116 family Zn-ribbon domain-containing protein [Pontibacter anaerobius]MCX2739420.1 DUF2116 family Zn-ribbon domain-containing protein [Pontibacter anaerobius]